MAIRSTPARRRRRITSSKHGSTISIGFASGNAARSLLQFARMRVRFWGTRGSVPTPGPSTVRYGGNTACVEMRTEAGTFFIFDSGTGIRELGLHLARDGGPVNAHLMLGHTHWDHI